MRPEKFGNKAVLVAVLALLLLVPIVLGQGGIGQLVSIEKTYGSQTTVYDSKTNKLEVSDGGQVKIALSFIAVKDEQNAEFLVVAPWAAFVTASEGIVNGEPASTTLLMDLRKGRSYRVEFFGELKQGSYVDIFKLDQHRTLRAYHLDIAVKATNAGTPKAEGSKEEVKVAEDALNEAKRRGFGNSVYDLKLIVAKAERDTENARKLLVEITETASTYVGTWTELSNRLAQIKQEARDSQTMQQVASYIVLAEDALSKGDLSTAAANIARAEQVVRPGLVGQAKKLLQTREALLAIAGVAVIAGLVLLRKVMRRASVVGLRGLL